MHHAHGYYNEHKDNVLPYCPSCHKKIHIEARKSGRCNVSVSKLNMLSINSVHRRQQREFCKQINFIENMMPYVELREKIFVWKNTIQCSTRFEASHGKKIYEIAV